MEPLAKDTAWSATVELTAPTKLMEKVRCSGTLSSNACLGRYRHLRVLFIALNFGRLGGLEIYNLNLVRALVRAGCTVDVWSVFDNKVCTEPLDNVHVQPLAPGLRPALSLYSRYFWQGLLLRRLQATGVDYDLVIAGHVKALPVVHQASRSCHWPYWVWTYGIEVWGGWSKEMKEEMLAAQHIVSISHFTASKILEHLPGISISILHNPVDVERFRPARDSLPPTRNSRLLTVGRLSKGRDKGHEVVMQALPLLNQRLGKPVEYYIVGDGDDLQRLKDYAANLGLQRAVQFLGRVSDAELVRAYQDCDVFVMPSRVERRPDGTWTGEGFGFVYIEAASCAKPVIASNQGGAPEAILDGVTGFAVDPTSPEAVAGAAYRLLSNPDLARRMGKAGRQFVVKNFSMEVFQRRVAELLRESGF